MQVLASLAASLLIGADDPAGGDKKFQGTWRWVEMTTDGRIVEEGDFEEMRMTVKGDRYTVQVGDMIVSKGVLRIRRDQDPMRIDREPDSGPDKGEVYKGIFKQDDEDAFTACWSFPGDDRPMEFSSVKGSRHLLEKLKRVKD
jgi:uncharacterized protein (TIGR03067 family)